MFARSKNDTGMIRGVDPRGHYMCSTVGKVLGDNSSRILLALKPGAPRIHKHTAKLRAIVTFAHR